LAGTLAVHSVAGAFLIVAGVERRTAPPTYAVRLVAAPAPDPDARKAPDAVDRPAEEKPTPVPQRAPKNTASRAAPPPVADTTRREAAPRTTPTAAPLPGERPSTGSDVATVSTEGVEFPFPEYLQNLVSQIVRRWQRPTSGTPLEAEVSFIVRRDGSIADFRFVKRSGYFAFDLEAQGAVEEVGRSHALGPLPDDWRADVLFVRFYFSPRRQ
jgi:outer membrane biosynthesis protein TonB